MLRNDIIIKEGEYIGYCYDLCKYFKDVLIEQLKSDDYCNINPTILGLIVNLNDLYDYELLRITFDYDSNPLVDVLVKEVK